MIGPNKDSSDYKLYQKGAPEHMTGKLLQPNNLEWQWLDDILDDYAFHVKAHDLEDITMNQLFAEHREAKLAITAKINEMLISELDKLLLKSERHEADGICNSEFYISTDELRKRKDEVLDGKQ